MSDNESNLRIILVSNAGDDENQVRFLGYDVVAIFTEIISDDSGETYPIYRSKTKIVENETNDVTFTLPELEKIPGNIIINVHNPDGSLEDSTELEKTITNTEIKIPPPKLIQTIPSEYSPNLGQTEPNLGASKKITGAIWDEDDNYKASNIQITVKGKTLENENNEITVFVTRTDPEGFFSALFPTDKFKEAHAYIAIKGFTTPQQIHLENNFFPQKILLPLKFPENYEEKPQDGEVPRHPDSEDFANSSVYTQDAQGECVTFNKPDRTLEEFDFYTVVRTTDPKIKGLTLDAPPPKLPPNWVVKNVEKIENIKNKKGFLKKIPRTITQSFSLSRALSSISTVRLDTEATSVLSNSKIDPAILTKMINDPDEIKPATFAKAEAMTLQQNLKNSVALWRRRWPTRSSLSEINPIDWDNTPTFYQSTTIAHGHILHFKQKWKSDGYSLGDLLYSMPLAPCQKKQIAILDWERREEASRTEELTAKEDLTADISRDRAVSDIVNSTISESVRGGSTAKTSSKSAGGSFFGLVSASGGKSKSSSTAWQNSSRSITGNSLNKLRDKTSQSASSIRSQRSTVIQSVRQGEAVTAQTEVVANHNHCHAITIQYFEVLRHLLVTQELADVQECLFIPLPISEFDNAKILRWEGTLRNFLLNKSLRTGFDALERIENDYEGSDLPEGAYADESILEYDGELFLEFRLSRPTDSEGEFDEGAWGSFAPFLWQSPRTIFNLFLLGINEQRTRDQIFERDIAPRIAEKFVQQLKFYVNNSNIQLNLDATLVSKYSSGVRLFVSIRPGGMTSPISRKDVRSIVISSETDLPGDSKVILHSGTLRYRTKYSSQFLFRNYRILNDISPNDTAIVSTSTLNRFELRNPREEDKELARKLKSELNEHLEYYHKIIWWNMDPDRRHMLLDGYIAPNSEGRSVASVVDKQVIGIVGNSLVMPVSRGFHLDPSFEVDKKSAEEPVDLLKVYQPTTPIAPLSIAIPTKGVFAESVMGECNSCEEKDESRFWRFEESPCGDTPTPIMPLDTGTRATSTDLTAKSLPNPVVNIQNAPQAPEPVGLAAAIQAITSPDIFRDVTGLTENQRNAITALKESFATTKHMADIGAKLGSQLLGGQNINKTSSAVQQAKKQGLIDESQSKEIMGGALKNMVGIDSDPVKNTLSTIKEMKNDNLIGTSDATELSKKVIDNAVGSSKNIMASNQIEGLLDSAGQGPSSVTLASSSGDSLNVNTIGNNPDIAKQEWDEKKTKNDKKSRRLRSVFHNSLEFYKKWRKKYIAEQKVGENPIDWLYENTEMFEWSDTWTLMHSSLYEKINKVRTKLGSSFESEFDCNTKQSWDDFTSLNPRNKVGGKSLSEHAYGKAVDVKPQCNPMLYKEYEFEVIKAVTKFAGEEIDFSKRLNYPDGDMGALWDIIKKASDNFKSKFTEWRDNSIGRLNELSAMINRTPEQDVELQKITRLLNFADEWAKSEEKRNKDGEIVRTFKFDIDGFFTISKEFVLAMTEQNLTWGAIWPGRVDLQHFEV